METKELAKKLTKELIKEYREKNGMSQTEFGQRVGVNKQTVSKWENGLTQPSISKIYEIAKETGIDLKYFIGDAEEGEWPFIYKRQEKYNVGLNSLFESIHDFHSLSMFLDSYNAAYNILQEEPNNIYGFMIINKSYMENGSNEALQPIDGIWCDAEMLKIEMLGETTSIPKETIINCECETTFNNTSFCFNVSYDSPKKTFLQFIIAFDEAETVSD